MVKIKFSSRLEGLFDVERLRPQPSKNFLPIEFKNMPIKPNNDKNIINFFPTAKACPSFSDVLNEGYVLVAPCDIWIKTDGYNYEYKTKKGVSMSIHPSGQLIDYYENTNVKLIIKIDNVWICETPKGYSVRQLPLLYHFNPDWYVAYGIIDTDQYYEINPQIVITSNKEEILIKQGEPLCYIIPFKRENYTLEITEYNKRKHEASLWNLLGTFKGAYIKNRKH